MATTKTQRRQKLKYKKKAPQFLPMSDHSPQITCVGYWVMFFINEQALDFLHACGASTARHRAQSPSLRRGLGIGVPAFCKGMCYINFIHGKDLHTERLTYIKSSWEGPGQLQKMTLLPDSLQTAMLCLHFGHSCTLTHQMYVHSNC